MASNSHEFTKVDICSRLDKCLNRRFIDVDSSGVFSRINESGKNKGVLGAVIEQSVLGFPADCERRPDLMVDGIEYELKTTGILIEKGAFRAKEPISVTAVAPETIAAESFETSAFWHKAEKLLIVWYRYEPAPEQVDNMAYRDFPIKGYEFHEWDDFDKTVLEHDWNIVRDFIADAQERGVDSDEAYPLISTRLNGELMYLDTSPKWPNRPRFRLKARTVSIMARKHFGLELEQLPGRYSNMSEVDAVLRKATRDYRGMRVADLCEALGMERIPNSKGIGSAVVVRMFGGKSCLMSKVELFEKVGLVGRTLVLTESGGRTEDMKLFPLDFDELANPAIAFEDSGFAENFFGTQLLVTVFEEPSASAPLKENRFVGFKRFPFSDAWIEEHVRPLWDELRDLVLNHKLREEPVLTKDGKRRYGPKTGELMTAPNFPKSKDGQLFIRGSGGDARSKTQVLGIRMYKGQSVWLKGSYLVECLRDVPFIE